MCTCVGVLTCVHVYACVGGRGCVRAHAGLAREVSARKHALTHATRLNLVGHVNIRSAVKQRVEFLRRGSDFTISGKYLG